MLKLIVISTVLIAMAMARPWYPWPGFPYYQGYQNEYHGYYGYHGPIAPVYHSKLIYYGHFQGYCEGAADGLYYVDEYNFAYCSNGHKTIQPCAEGSANPALTHFNPGGYYGFYDFCSINLVAHGYNAAVPSNEHYVVEDKPVYAPEEPVYNEKTYFEENHTYEESPEEKKVY